MVKNAKSRDHIGKDGSKTLRQHFVAHFGHPDSPRFKAAQRAFAASLAANGIVCYLLSVKDRHNGNVLVDDHGRLIHIDFGFLLGISPGGNLGFETAAFKLSSEMVDILDGLESELFQDVFLNYCVKAFLVARANMRPLMALVFSFADSGLPCFNHKLDNLKKMEDRFFPLDTESEAARKLRHLVLLAANSTTTLLYDGIQKLQNNIYSNSWK